MLRTTNRPESIDANACSRTQRNLFKRYFKLREFEKQGFKTGLPRICTDGIKDSLINDRKKPKNSAKNTNKKIKFTKFVGLDPESVTTVVVVQLEHVR